MPPEDHQLTINGKRWLLRFTTLRGNADGWTFYTDPPRMLVSQELKGTQRLETVLHEIAHAVLGPQISEEAITELARIQRRAIVMLGWKFVAGETKPRE